MRSPLRLVWRVHLLVLCMWTASASAGVCAVPQYRIRELGMFSFVEDINDSGQVVGTYYGTDSQYRALLWQDGLPAKDLGTLGGTQAVAHGINNLGQVVGRSSTADGSIHAFLWQEGSPMRDLGTLEGGSSVALDINDHGQVVGVSELFRAFLWQEGAPMQDLGPFVARGINNSGAVVGGDFSHIAIINAFLWQEGSLQVLGTLGGDYSTATAINDSGQIAGASCITSNPLDGFRACLWTDGSIRDLGTLGGKDSEALGMNNAGQVVGRSATPTSFRHAFLWDGNSMHDLGTLGGSRSEAVAINNLGWIVGYATDASERTHAVLWEPIPEPTSLAAITLGLAGLGVGVRKRVGRREG